MKNNPTLFIRTFLLSLLFIGASSLLFLSTTGCGVYKMVDASVPDSVKTVRVNFIENRARYVNPQLSPQLTDKLRQKIIGQTRLTQVNNDNAHYEISGSVSDYSVSTSAISGQRTTNNRLSVTIHIILLKRLDNKSDEFDVTRSFEFDARQTLTQAESTLKDEMIRTLVDEIFNRIFSNW